MDAGLMGLIKDELYAKLGMTDLSKPELNGDFDQSAARECLEKRDAAAIGALFVQSADKLLSSGAEISHIRDLVFPERRWSRKLWRKPFIWLIPIVPVLICLLFSAVWNELKYPLMGMRCLVPNNYLTWEATRPLSDCSYCLNIVRPIILPNCTAEEFQPYAYTSQPIIVKGAAKHWKAITMFDYDFFKNLYNEAEGAYETAEYNCQFLPFQSDFNSLSDVFRMSDDRAKNKPGEASWYIGWENCNPVISEKIRQYYPKPHFLPEDSESSASDNIFMGYDPGATMHLDFISKLMWQAQLKGNKTWYLVPTPECEDVCKPISFYVEPGDAVLLDTRVWYHGTSVAPGEFSLTVQSEYG